MEAARQCRPATGCLIGASLALAVLAPVAAGGPPRLRAATAPLQRVVVFEEFSRPT